MKPYIKIAESFILNHLDSASTMLVVMGIIGTITSSIAQQIGIKANKNLSEETKSFLINQEENDCMLSAGLTWLTGTGSKKLVMKLTEKGYLLNNKVRNAADVVAIKNGMTHRQLAKSGFYKVEGIRPELNICLDELKPLKRDFRRCQEGLAVVAAVGAAILTTNLIVPILRNKLARPIKQKEQPTSLSNYVTQKPATKLMMTYQPTYSTNTNMKI